MCVESYARLALCNERDQYWIGPSVPFGCFCSRTWPICLFHASLSTVQPACDKGSASTDAPRASFFAPLRLLCRCRKFVEGLQLSFSGLLVQRGDHVGKARYESAENITQGKEKLKFVQMCRVLESAYDVNCRCRHLESPWANDVAEVIDLVYEELSFLQVQCLHCVVKKVQKMLDMRHQFVWRLRKDLDSIQVNQHELPFTVGE